MVAGAGAIGCYVGGLLAAAGRDVTFLGRDRLAQEIALYGLTLTDHAGTRTRVTDPQFSSDPSCLAQADIVLVTVKSAATHEIGETIAARAPTATVVSLQNGITNADTLRAPLQNASVFGGVVAFNVAQTAPGTFHQGTSGGITLETCPNSLVARLSTPQLNVIQTQDFEAVQWGKLLVNLNNALNAVSGLTLLEQLHIRAWRRILATQMTETLQVLKASKITPAKFSPVAPQIVPHILRLPNPLFTRIAKAMLTVDPQARSSMQDDLIARRITEIDALQGEVLRLATAHGLSCPMIKTVVAAIRVAETAQAGPPNLNPQTLLTPFS